MSTRCEVRDHVSSDEGQQEIATRQPLSSLCLLNNHSWPICANKCIGVNQEIAVFPCMSIMCLHLELGSYTPRPALSQPARLRVFPRTIPDFVDVDMVN